MKDKRLNWEYKGCKIVPIACHRDSDWGKEVEPIDFGFGMRSQYWRIDFPDTTWIYVTTKPECRSYIDKTIEKHQYDPLKEMVRVRLEQFAMRIETHLDSTGEAQIRMVIGRKNKRV